MDEVEQDTSGFLPLVGITEVSQFQNISSSDKCMLLLKHRHSRQKISIHIPCFRSQDSWRLF